MEAAELFCREIAQWAGENSDDEDALLLAASEEFEETELRAHNGTTATPTPPAAAQSDRNNQQGGSSTLRFAPPQSSEQIQLAQTDGIPDSTKRDTKYCLKIWADWSKERERTTNTLIPPLTTMPASELSFWLVRFVLEARKRDGKPYPPNSLLHIVMGLVRHMRWSGRCIDVLKDAEFHDFRATLDSEMKRLQGIGLGSSKRQAEVITVEEEETLWRKGLLGNSTPQVLLDTMVYYCGLYFALRSGKEHRQLRNSPCQIEVVERSGERPYLRYTEDVSKNRQGGLNGRKVKPKVVLHHANTESPDRCFVRLFKIYRQRCPPNAPPSAFYLQPLQKPTPICWYSSRPLGHTTLGRTIGRICQSAGIPGYKTNHSLRATSATRLYQSGVDEQLVMERTGHRSLDGVRSYKRTSDSQREALSDILNRQGATSTSTHKSAVTLQSSQHSQLLQGLSLPSATFSHCTVTFNIGCAASGSGEANQKPPRKRRAVIFDDSDSD